MAMGPLRRYRARVESFKWRIQVFRVARGMNASTKISQRLANIKLNLFVRIMYK